MAPAGPYRGRVTGKRGRRRLDARPLSVTWSTPDTSTGSCWWTTSLPVSASLKTGVLFEAHRAAIESWVSNMLTTIPQSAEGKLRLPSLLTPPVPRSLRDVEEPITIYADL